MPHLAKIETCKGCEGSTMQINEYGILRECPLCAVSWDVFSNQYGTDLAEAPVIYYDEETKMITRVNNHKDEILLPNGLIIPNQ